MVGGLLTRELFIQTLGLSVDTFDAIAAFVNQGVVPGTQAHPVVDTGGPSIGPMLYVVDL
jgi:hypothetical protein